MNTSSHQQRMTNIVQWNTSPVVCRPITTQYPAASDDFTSSTIAGTFRLRLHNTHRHRDTQTDTSTHRQTHRHTQAHVNLSLNIVNIVTVQTSSIKQTRPANCSNMILQILAIFYYICNLLSHTMDVDKTMDTKTGYINKQWTHDRQTMYMDNHRPELPEEAEMSSPEQRPDTTIGTVCPLNSSHQRLT